MNLQDLKKKPTEEKRPEQKPEGQKLGKTAQKRLIIAAAVAIVIIGAFVGMKQSGETNRRIERLVNDLEDRADDYFLSYPVIGEKSGDDLYWGEGGYFEQVKGKKKFPAAVAEKMKTVCIYASEEGEEETFHSSGFEKACRMAAVLEYVKYENEDVKAVMDTLMAQAAEAAKGDNWITSRSLFMTFAKYDSLPYYGNSDVMPKEEIAAAFAKEWQKIKREMSTGKADLSGFLEDAAEVASTAPIKVPEYGTVRNNTSSAAAEGSAPALVEVYLDMDKMAPYDEILAALEEYGEEAIFRNGEGGYYDGSREKGNLYGDFRTQYISGRVRRTGQEDAFTEQYLRDHYDKPSKTYTYFKDEQIGALPEFYSDTERVFVYDDTVYAFTPYAIYTTNGNVYYDVETAERAERKHVPLEQVDLLMSDVNGRIRPYLRELSDFDPRYEYDIDNSLVTVYLKAPQGTTEALKRDGQIPIKEDTTMTWENLQESLCNICEEMSKAVRDVEDIRSAMWGTQEETGIALILASDVDPDSGLLSILNGEVVQDNSMDLPVTAPPDNSEAENAEDGAED